MRVELEESWLADVGVGAMSLTSALRLAETGPQATPHEYVCRIELTAS